MRRPHLLREAGKVAAQPPDGVWKAGLRPALQVGGEGGAMRLRSKKRAAPHPALRATFPSELGKGLRHAQPDAPASAPAAFACAMALATVANVGVPSCINSTAVEGTMTIVALLRFRPSYSMFIARK